MQTPLPEDPEAVEIEASVEPEALAEPETTQQAVSELPEEPEPPVKPKPVRRKPEQPEPVEVVPVLTPEQQAAAEELRNNEVFQRHWYHSIELLPGVFTQGNDHRNVSVTRKLLKGCNIKGKNCLDIGTQNGLVSILLKRRGAARVTAQDIQDLGPQMDLILGMLGIDWRYYQFGEQLEVGSPQNIELTGLPPQDFNYITGPRTFDGLR